MTWAARIPTLAGLRYPQASFVLDFANNYYRGSGAQGSSPSMLPGYNFTRASTGYAEDAQGNLVLFGPNVPRITNKGVLIEEGRANLLLRSQALGASPWVAFNISSSNPTVTNNAALAPDGTMTATQIDFPAVSVWQISALRQAVTVTNPSTLAPSIYLRASSPVNMRMRQGNAAAGYTTIAVTTSWQRFEIPSGTTASTLFNFDILVGDTNSSGAVTVYAWGAQLEAGSFPTSYIPTTSSTATRAADVFSYAHTVAAVGTVGATATPSPTVGSPRIIGSNSGAVTYLYQTSAAANNYGTYNGATTLIKSGATAVGTVSAAVSWDGTNRSVTYNGLTPATSASAISNGSVTAINIGSDNGTSNFWNNYIQRIAIYPFAASDAQLQTISSGQF